MVKYVRNVARSIEENIERLTDRDGKVIKKIADEMQAFYLSLFDRKKGTENFLNNLTRCSDSLN